MPRTSTGPSARPAPPSTKVYAQSIPSSGYGYLTTRDGTKLAIDVHLPSGPGPYPTLVEYSGYGYANPAGGQSSIAGGHQAWSSCSWSGVTSAPSGSHAWPTSITR